MKSEIFFKKVVLGDQETVIKKISDALARVGFGVLARYDMHLKIKEKTGKDFEPLVILGVCHPDLAYKMLSINTDVSAVMPCNVVVRGVQAGKYSIEISKAAPLVQYIQDQRLSEGAKEVDVILESVLNNI